MKLSHALAMIEATTVPPYQWRTSEQAGGGLSVALWAALPDRDTGYMTDVILRRRFPYATCGAVQLEEFLWRLYCEAVVHEAAEQFTINGKRVRDPHTGD